MDYTKYSYLYPPRPEAKIPAGMIKFYDKRGWWSQAKLNGTCSVIFTNGSEFHIKTRHNDEHKAWEPKPEHIEFFKSTTKDGKWNVFVAELMHNKSPLLKDVLYVFDILVWNGNTFMQSSIPFAARQELLEKIIPGNEQDLWYEHNKFIVRARNFVGDSKALYDRITEVPYVEGLVMKNPTATLDLCYKEDNNTGWQVKCRKVTKNYGF